MRKKTVLISLGTITTLALLTKNKATSKVVSLNGNYPLPDRAQHAVFYVNDLEESQNFYERIFDLQYSATNHPDSSAAMKIVGHTMKFFSFGYYHHDICFVQNPNITLDNDQWSHYSLKLADGVSLEEIKNRLDSLGVPYYEGRILPQLEEKNEEVIYFKDPNGHKIEVIA